jgi:cytochrome P450
VTYLTLTRQGFIIENVSSCKKPFAGSQPVEFHLASCRFSYFPFGGGIRGCIGEPFAWMEGILIIATIAQKWTVRLVPGQRIKLDPAITLRLKYGMKMKLIQRKN